MTSWGFQESGRFTCSLNDIKIALYRETWHRPWTETRDSWWKGSGSMEGSKSWFWRNADCKEVCHSGKKGKIFQQFNYPLIIKPLIIIGWFKKSANSIIYFFTFYYLVSGRILIFNLKNWLFMFWMEVEFLYILKRTCCYIKKSYSIKIDEILCIKYSSWLVRMSLKVKVFLLALPHKS